MGHRLSALVTRTPALETDRLAAVGRLALDLGLFDIAREAADKGLEVAPDSLALVLVAARAMEAQGAGREAAERLEPTATSSAATPKGWGGLLELASLWRTLGERDAEARAIDLASRHHPTTVEVALAAADSAQLRGDRERARMHLERALGVHADSAPILARLGVLHAEWGDTQRALDHFDRALAIDPSSRGADGGRLAVLRASDAPPEEVFVEHLLHHVRFCRVGQTFATDEQREARRRIVFLLPDRTEEVEPVLSPLLDHLDRSRFDVWLAIREPRSERSFERLVGRADGSFRLGRTTPLEIAKLLAREGTDVAVDLCGHGTGSLLEALSFRAAPLQVSWLGALGTTGLLEVDLRITDSVLDPAPLADALHVERLARLEGCAFAFRGHDAAVVERQGAPVVFGSSADAAFLDDRSLAAFCDVLTAVPGSRLVLCADGATDPVVRSRLSAVVGARAGLSERIELREAKTPTEQLALFGEVDVVLDTLGRGHLRTLCEAPWMGVPFVTLEGEHAARRVGATIARALGLEAFVARDLADYVAIAARIAADASARAELRSDLRRRTAATLGDGAAFAARFAAALERGIREAQVGDARAVKAETAEAAERAALLVRRATEALQTGQAARAAALSLAATLATPHDAEAHNLHGNALIALGDEHRAEQAYVRSRECDPALFKPLNNLANLASKRGDKARAVELFREALLRNPNAFRVHANLGAALQEVGRSAEAGAHLRRSLELQPNPIALVALAKTLLDGGNTHEALGALEAAVRLGPTSFEHEFLLGEVYFGLGRRDEAVRAFETAALRGEGRAANTERVSTALVVRGFAEVAARLVSTPGPPISMRVVERVVARLSGSHREADAFLQAVGEQRRMVEALHLLHRRLTERGEWSMLEQSLRRAVESFPDDSYLKRTLGLFLGGRGRELEAANLYQQALAIDPDDADAECAYWRSRGNDGQVDEAIEGMIALRGARPEVAATPIILAFMNYSDSVEPRAMFEEHRRWGERLERRLSPLPAVVRSERPARLKVGYVSPDFREHSVARFVEPILHAHDRERFEVHVYHTLPTRDAITERIAGDALSFHHVHDLDDEALARRIVDDGIDILVDLSGHTEHDRLGVFARRPAPVQVTYLGYPGTTGLTRIDYRITDALADPAGSEAWSTEELVRLPTSAWCFDTRLDAAPASVRPHDAPVTFGSFNTLRKTTPHVVAVFGEVLSAVPGSRLVMKTGGLERPEVRSRFSKMFEAHGIGSDRLDLRGWDADRRKHLEAYRGIDVALDPFPYGGTTTTCEALWMGVPVVTLVGTRHAGRVGHSLLSSVGLASLAASTTGEYVEIARRTAADHTQRKELRLTLRERMRGCALGNPALFVPDLERAYDEMFVRALARPRVDEEDRGRVELLSDAISIDLPDSLEVSTAYRVAEGTATLSHEIDLARRCLVPGDAVIDVGAGLGVFSLLAASLVGPSGSVLAVEPNVRASRHLARSARRNGFPSLRVERWSIASATGGASRGGGSQEDHDRDGGAPTKLWSELRDVVARASFLRLSASAARAISTADLAPIAAEGPIVCVGMGSSRASNRELSRSLEGLGYRLHAWRAAPRCLEPVESADGCEWLVAVPRARLPLLAERGLLGQGDDPVSAQALEPSADELSWFRALPYVRALFGRPRELPFALRRYVVSRTSPSPAVRLAALRSALGAAVHDVDSMPTIGRRLGLARIAFDIGELDMPRELLGQLERDVRKTKHLALDEPFLCVDSRFERFAPASVDVSRWLLAQVVEQQLCSGGASTHDLPPVEIATLRSAIDMGFDDGTLARRLKLMVERHAT